MAGSVFDTYVDTYAGAFIKKEEKQALIDTAAVFEVRSVVYKAVDTYGPQFVVGIILDGEERSLGFAESQVGPDGKQTGVPSRDDLLRATIAYFAEEGEPFPARLEKSGNSILIKDARTEAE